MEKNFEFFLTKESHIDVEGQLFFEIYYKEMISLGLLDNPNNKIIPNISTNSSGLYLIFDDIANDLGNGEIFTMPEEFAKDYIDDRNYDSLGELAKLYYYMIPIVEGREFRRNTINRTFFVAYEFDENKTIKNSELFFKFPRNKYSFENETNFTPKADILNPLVNVSKIDDINITNNIYSTDNWFTKQDLDFRDLINLSEEGYSKTSFSHLNNEYNGYIYKSAIMSLQQYIKRNNSYYIINIIFFYQINNTEVRTNVSSNFILQRNPDFPKIKNEIKQYSDNSNYFVLKSNSMESTLNSIDYQFFHYGLIRNINNTESFIKNGISFDSFNLDYFNDVLKHYNNYTTIKSVNVDIRYLNTLYLYKMLFQSSNYIIIKNKKEKSYLYHFNDTNKIKYICKEINFNEYKNYLDKKCWREENSFFYDEQKFINASRININS